MITPIKPKDSKIISCTQEQNCIYFTSELGILRVLVFNNDIIRVSFTAAKSFDIHQAEEFLTPATKPEYTFIKSDNFYSVCTKHLICKIDPETSYVSFFQKEDSGVQTLLFSEKPHNSHHVEKFHSFISAGKIETQEIKTADGVKKQILAADKTFDKTLYRTRLDFLLDADEKIFGLGQCEHGKWDLRHTKQYLNQANKKIAIPSFISSKGYSVLFSTQSPSIFCDTDSTYFYTTADYYLDYYFIAPLQKSDIVKCTRQITGKALIPPKWAFGYVQSQERYETQEEILNVAAEFKKRDIPLSCIVLDWLSWEDGMWGQKSFDKSRFPTPDIMIQTLAKNNIHFMISIWPSMDEKCQNYKEMLENNCLLPGVNICNSFDKKARELYWKQAREGLSNFGVESWWCDSSEPSTPEWNHYEIPPEELQFAEYLQNAQDIMPLEKSNAYGYYHAKGMYEGQKSDFPERRMLILTRSGVLGSQKYGVTLWSGDTSASWETLQNQLLAALHFSLSGIPYWTFDIGGFFVKKGINWYWNGDYDNTVENPSYRELYTRWLQLGAFLPMFRAHGTDCRREPWAFDDESHVFYNAITDFIKLRYTLMPYIYSVAGKVWKDDEQFIRPLFTQFNDPKTVEISDQFMFGPSIMVCPVIKPMYYDKQGSAINTKKIRRVYLPADCAWYDWWTGQKYDGGKWLDCDAPIYKIPLFVKEGCVIPVNENNSIKALRFPDNNGTCEPFELYEDDGVSNDYLGGKNKVYKIF